MATVIRLLLLVFSAGTVCAQDSDVVFKRIPSESGLSQNSIFAIIQDHRGFLWVGTSEGLNRYDGYDFVRYRHDPEDRSSLSDNRIETLFEDRAGTLWVGTFNGANRFDERNHRFVRIAVEGAESVTINRIREDSTGRLMFDTSIGLCRLERNEEICRLVRDPPPPLEATPAAGRTGPRMPAGMPVPHVVLEDRDGALWLGTDDLYRYYPATGVLQRFQLELTGPNDLKSVRTLYQDRSGTIWAGTLGGLYRWDPYARHFSHRTHDVHNPDSLSSRLVSALYEDSSGLLWIGTIGGGLTRLDPRTNRVTRFRHDPDVPHSLSSDVVWAIHEDERGTFWVATDEGLNRLNVRSSQFRVISCPPAGYKGHLSHAVASIAAAGPDVLWLGLFGGSVAKVDTRTSTCQSVASNEVLGGALVHVGPSGTLWAGVEGLGLQRLDGTTGGSRHFPLRANAQVRRTRRTVWAIHRGRDGMLWLGTDIGLAKFDPSNESFTRVWDPDLPSSVVYAILEDSAHRLWLSTTRGICYFDPAAPEHRRFGCFGTADGLQNTEFIRRSALRTRDGRMFFGGLEGLTSFDPAAILRTNPIAPPVVLTDVELRNREESRHVNPVGLDAIVLSYKDYSFSFTFVALSFTNPAKNRYSYMLEGFDPDWVSPSTRRIAQYTNVPPGTYVFRVKGSNNDGVWNHEGATLRVTITPPFWQRWWFRTLSVGAIAGLLLLAHGHRVRQVLAIERIRRQVATDLHDDVGSGLSQVAILSEVAKRDAAPAAAALMTETATLARTMRESLGDIVWAVDPRKDRLTDLVYRMRQVTLNGLESDGIAVDFHAPPDGAIDRIGLAPDRRRHLLLIFKEAVTNIGRHAQASRVSIYLTVRGRTVSLIISDDGCGFDSRDRSDGHGLQSMSRRAGELGAHLTLQSTPGAGTTIRVDVPLG